MLRFFRSLRRKLIEEDNMNKYVWYALGEIFLVMVGILLALYVNNWNQERLIKLEETFILQSLRGDLEDARKEIKSTLDSDLIIKDDLELLISEGPDARIEFYLADSVEHKLYHALVYLNHELPVIQTYDDLKISGNTSIISNRNIRNAFADLQFALEEISRQSEDNLLVQQLGLDNIVQRKIDNTVTRVINGLADIGTANIESIERFIIDDEVINGMGLKLYLLSNLITDRTDMINKIDGLLVLIDKELEN